MVASLDGPDIACRWPAPGSQHRGRYLVRVSRRSSDRSRQRMVADCRGRWICELVGGHVWTGLAPFRWCLDRGVYRARAPVSFLVAKQVELSAALGRALGAVDCRSDPVELDRIRRGSHQLTGGWQPGRWRGT